MPVAWIPIDGGISACHNMRKKKYNVYWRSIKMCVGSIQLGNISTFWDRKLYMNFLDFHNWSILVQRDMLYIRIHWEVLEQIDTWKPNIDLKCTNTPWGQYD